MSYAGDREGQRCWRRRPREPARGSAPCTSARTLAGSAFRPTNRPSGGALALTLGARGVKGVVHGDHLSCRSRHGPAPRRDSIDLRPGCHRPRQRLPLPSRATLCDGVPGVSRRGTGRSPRRHHRVVCRRRQPAADGERPRRGDGRRHRVRCRHGPPAGGTSHRADRAGHRHRHVRSVWRTSRCESETRSSYRWSRRAPTP
jgi:hypothetical protein